MAEKYTDPTEMRNQLSAEPKTWTPMSGGRFQLSKLGLNSDFWNLILLAISGIVFPWAWILMIVKADFAIAFSEIRNFKRKSDAAGMVSLESCGNYMHSCPPV